jgi:predicted O-linked N-acetylglucosamine transferase (SPINDLY family)
MPSITQNLHRAQQLFLAGRFDESRAAFQAVLADGSHAADAWQGLGLVSQAEGELDAAVEALARAVALAPGVLEFHAQLASALQEAGRHAEALAAWRETTRRFPACAVAWENLGVVEQALGDAAAARAAYARACALEETAARRLKLATAISPIPDSVAAIDAERAAMDAALDAFLARPSPIADPVREALWTNFYLAFHGASDRALQEKTARAYLAACPSLAYVAPPRARERGAKLRIGFISKFLHNHSIGRTSRGFFAQLPRERFETIAIFIEPFVDDELARAMRADAARSLVVPQDLPAARAAIAALELDVLF